MSSLSSKDVGGRSESGARESEAPTISSEDAVVVKPLRGSQADAQQDSADAVASTHDGSLATKGALGETTPTRTADQAPWQSDAALHTTNVDVPRSSSTPLKTILGCPEPIHASLYPEMVSETVVCRSQQASEPLCTATLANAVAGPRPADINPPLHVHVRSSTQKHGVVAGCSGNHPVVGAASEHVVQQREMLHQTGAGPSTQRLTMAAQQWLKEHQPSFAGDANSVSMLDHQATNPVPATGGASQEAARQGSTLSSDREQASSNASRHYLGCPYKEDVWCAAHFGWPMIWSGHVVLHPSLECTSCECECLCFQEHVCLTSKNAA
jgi:hypothetical protein